MTDLSSAARAVLKAACIHHGLFNEEIIQRRRMIAAALRAAANAVEISPYKIEHSEFWSALLAIAAELEGTNE